LVTLALVGCSDATARESPAGNLGVDSNGWRDQADLDYLTTKIRKQIRRAHVQLAGVGHAMAMRLLDESLGPNRLERAYHFVDFHHTITENIDSVVAALRDRQDDEFVVLAQRLLEWYTRYQAYSLAT
jgi:hypothetical protein